MIATETILEAVRSGVMLARIAAVQAQMAAFLAERAAEDGDVSASKAHAMKASEGALAATKASDLVCHFASYQDLAGMAGYISKAALFAVKAQQDAVRAKAAYDLGPFRGPERIDDDILVNAI